MTDLRTDGGELLVLTQLRIACFELVVERHSLRGQASQRLRRR
jgi:hypothetical protein